MITAIIQARISSTRLPRKVLMEFSGNTLLGHIIERLTFAKSISRIIVATTTNPADEPLVEWLKANKIVYYRGDESDVLGRYYDTAASFNATHIARITSDDPFKDPAVIDSVADFYFERGLDFAYNNKPPSFAEGLDTEIFSFAALHKAYLEAEDPFEREHVTQHFYRNPATFKQANFSNAIDFSHLRWTIDTPADLAMAEKVYEHLYKPGGVFLFDDILALLQKDPSIAKINADVTRSTMYKK